MSEQQIPTSEVLNRAADGLRRDGWLQGTPDGACSGPNPTCASIAVRRAANFDGMAELPAARALWEHLGGSSFGDIYRWNDAKGRTAAEVIEVLRAAAVIEAARERTASDAHTAAVAIQ